MSLALASSRRSASIDVTADAAGPAWNEYVEGRREASIYHLAEWGPLMRRVFGHHTRYLTAREGGL